MENDSIELKWKSKEGYDCFIRYMDGRHRCGYVKVDKNNITKEINNYNDVPVSVHGGLTYGSEGEWGFDCAHLGDTVEYWTLERVKEETKKLSEQLSKLSWKEIVESKLEYMPDWFKKRVKFAKSGVEE